MDDDPNSVLLQLGLIFILILLNAFFASAEIALVSVRKTRIKQLIDEGSANAKIVQYLLDNPTGFMSTVQIGVTFVGFLASAVAATNLAQLPMKWLESIGLSHSLAASVSVFAITLVLGLVTLVLGEIAPKSLAMQRSEKLALAFAKPIRFLSVIALPAVAVVSFLSNLVLRPFGSKAEFAPQTMTEEELKLIVEDSEESGVLEEEEKEMIHSIFDFTDTIARQVMVPRTDMDCASFDVKLEVLLEIITSTGHSRIPIYKDTRDNIIGVVHAKDLLAVLSSSKSNESFDVTSVMRSAYFIPETKDIDELLAEFRLGNVQMAIVCDEYGGTAGIVTVEDVLEEIVGEIHDEYDAVELPQIEVKDERNTMVSARLSMEDLNEKLELNLPESEAYDTVGGFVFDLFGHQPQAGDTVAYENIDFKICNMDKGRINTILITQNESEEAGENSDDSSGDAL